MGVLNFLKTGAIKRSLAVVGQTISLATAVEASPSREEWDDLGTKMVPESRFLSANWYEPWGEHILGNLPGWGGPIQYLTARDETGCLVGILPFATQLKAGTRFLSLGGYFLPFRGYPAVRSAADDVTRAFARYLTERTDFVGVRLGPVTNGDPVGALLPRALADLGWHLADLTTEGRQIVQLPSTIAEYQESLDPAELKNIRRRERKMRRERRVNLQFLSSDRDEDWDAAIRDMAEVEARSWLPRYGGDLHFPGDASRSFWKSVLRGKHEGLTARIWILRCDDVPIAFDFNIDSGSTRYSLFAHYAEEARVYGAGMFLMMCEVEDAISRGLLTIDLGPGDPGYKKFWHAQRSGMVVDSIGFRPGLHGAVLTGLHAAQRSLRRMRTSRSEGQDPPQQA